MLSFRFRLPPCKQHWRLALSALKYRERNKRPPEQASRGRRSGGLAVDRPETFTCIPSAAHRPEQRRLDPHGPAYAAASRTSVHICLRGTSTSLVSSETHTAPCHIIFLLVLKTRLPSALRRWSSEAPRAFGSEDRARGVPRISDYRSLFCHHLPLTWTLASCLLSVVFSLLSPYRVRLSASVGI